MSWVPPDQPAPRADPHRPDADLDNVEGGAGHHGGRHSGKRGSAPWVRVVGAVVAVGLVGGMLSSLLLSGTDDTSKADGEVRSLREVVAELSTFIEGQRSERFRHPVKVALLDGAAFEKRLLEDAEEDREDVEKTEELLGLLGLLEPTGGLFDALNRFLSAAVLGFYDPKTDELVVRGDETGPFVRLTLVHELTHALDDQLFDLDREEMTEADDETGLGFSALVEGSALTVESAYRRSLTPSERSRASTEEGQFGDDLPAVSIPEVIPALVGFPYEVGEDLISTIERHGGMPALVDAFARPPTTSEQLLHPDLYIRGEGPITVDPPPADGALIDQGSIGELILQLMLGKVLDDAGDVRRATEGWGGDWYVAWREGSTTCLRATFAMDTEEDLRELVAAIETWSALNDDSQVDEGEDSVTLTAC